jgi:hypothetical protein
VVTPGMTVGTIGPWPGSYGGFATSFGGATFTSGYWGGGWGGGYLGDYWGEPYWGGGYGGYWGGPYGPGYYALPPLVIPAETLYGPGPVRRLMGLDPPLGTPIVNNTIINLPSQAQGFGVVAPGQAPAAPAGGRVSNAQARDLAKRQIAGGDNFFAKQQYAQALDAYKQASRAAPDLADSHFRQMVALVALGRYEAAIDAVKTGMRVGRNTVNGEFQIPAMYGDNLVARTAHIDELARLTAERPSSDLFFLTGVMLFFDNPPQRSAPFFERAAELAAADRWHIDVFREVLKRLPVQAAERLRNAPGANGPAVNVPVRQKNLRVPPEAAADGAREI